MFWKSVLLIAAIIPATATAQSAGKLGTLPHGIYQCSLPGDAAGSAWVNLPGKQFTIDNASSYHTADGAGTYLFTGNRVVFTRGPMNGMRFERTSSQTLRWLDENGELSRVRCTRSAGSI